MLIQEKFVEIKGAKIHYLELGNGRTVILHHGARFNAYTWNQVGIISAIAEVGYGAI